MPLPLEAFAISGLYLIRDLKVRQHIAPILFFFRSMCITSCQRRTRDNSLTHISEVLRESLNRRVQLSPIAFYNNFLCKTKKALLLLFSKFQRAIDSCPKGLCPKVSRIAGEDLEAVKPPARAPNRASLNTPVPIGRTPVRGHSPEIVVGSANIEDIRAAVGQQDSVPLPVCLLFKQAEQTSEFNLDLISQLGENRSVQRGSLQLVYDQFGIRDVLLDLTLEQSFEVFASPADVGDFKRFVVADKTLNACGCGSSDSLEQAGSLRRCLGWTQQDVERLLQGFGVLHPPVHHIIGDFRQILDHTRRKFQY